MPWRVRELRLPHGALDAEATALLQQYNEQLSAVFNVFAGADRPGGLGASAMLARGQFIQLALDYDIRLVPSSVFALQLMLSLC